MTTANQLRHDLESQQRAQLAAIRALERKRADISLAAHTGDVRAKKRLNTVCLALAAGNAVLGELAEALDDLEPQVAREELERQRAQRVNQAAYLDAGRRRPEPAGDQSHSQPRYQHLTADGCHVA